MSNPVPPRPSLPHLFVRRKNQILSALALPAAEYEDISPKGSIDEGIRDLIDEINAGEGFVTTSSCAGRVSVFLEGQKMGRDALGGGHPTIQEEKLARVGGKGGGGRWLFVSHDPVGMGELEGDIAALLGMKRSSSIGTDTEPFTENRLIHFKFEPMILHVLTASSNHAQIILSAAIQSGFRESGAVGLAAADDGNPTPVVAVRSNGLALESIVGYLTARGEEVCTVSEVYLQSLIMIADDRFRENNERINRFRTILSSMLLASNHLGSRRKKDGLPWEDASVRRERKRAEGLKRSLELQQHPKLTQGDSLENSSLYDPDLYS